MFFSAFRLEDEMVLRRSLSESLSLYEDDFRPSSRRGSNSVRRSIFRKRRHQRNNSKDSREFGSFSDASLNSDSVPVLDGMLTPSRFAFYYQILKVIWKWRWLMEKISVQWQAFLWSFLSRFAVKYWLVIVKICSIFLFKQEVCENSLYDLSLSLVFFFFFFRRLFVYIH